ncbi:MAG: RHS repeat-associated core domain-containing protein [Pirellulaceae bacterium]|nr:RHS repeat-associated core domain-containing protein [Pirellulaceae bacterium]
MAGHQATHTDFAGKVWSTIDDTCCGKSTASKNPLGHGSIRNTDPAGRVVHTATVADVQDHVANMGSPVDAKTLAESTTLFDSLGRTKASTTWLVALGAVDPASPPIAGLGSVPAANGLTTQYLYDNNPDGTAVGRSYTARGELYQLTHAGTTIDTRVYDNGGRMTSSTYNNGVSETRAYGTDNTLSSISFSGAPIGNLTYGWDANKNKTSEAIAGTMSNYGFTVPTNGYDSEDRLVSFNRTSGLTQAWNLSLVGDWNSVTTNGTAQTRTHGPTHELLTAGGQNVSTDTKGNITLIPAALRPNASSLLSNWDFDNRLNTADVGNNGSIDVTYKFDALGRRVFRDDGTTATVFVQAGQQTIADYTAGTAAASPTHRYVYASYIDEPVLRFKPSGSETLYYHRNQQYSVVALTNASAAIVERYAYSAYGVPTITNAAGTVLPVGSVNNRYMYTGREWDSVIAQYHYRARMYDANLGRFASRDPIGYGDGLNVSLFLHCGPLTGLDATGEGAFGWPRIIIDPGEFENPGKCGSRHSQRWEFLLDRGNGKDRIKDAGYIVQKVTVECEQADCECGHCGVPRRKSYSYFEAWYVEENDEKAHGTTVYGHGLGYPAKAIMRRAITTWRSSILLNRQNG